MLCGADPTVANKEGTTCWDLAAMCSDEMVQTFERVAARQGKGTTAASTSRAVVLRYREAKLHLSMALALRPLSLKRMHRPYGPRRHVFVAIRAFRDEFEPASLHHPGEGGGVHIEVVELAAGKRVALVRQLGEDEAARLQDPLQRGDPRARVSQVFNHVA